MPQPRSGGRRRAWEPAGSLYLSMLHPEDVLARCEEVLAGPTTYIQFKHLDPERTEACATFTTRYGKVISVFIYIDKWSTGCLTGVLHEVLHVALDTYLSRFSSPLAEEIVVAFERYLYPRIRKTRRGQWIAWIEEALARPLPADAPTDEEIPDAT